MDLHLFSSPGERGIQNILAVSRPYLANRPNPTVAYLPAASVRYNWLDFTREAFEGLATVELVDVENMVQADVETHLDRATIAYIPGGNTFLLNDRLHQRRILPLLRQKILAGLPLVAFSAGTTLCGVDILASNDMNVCATINFSALGLLPYTFNVHYPARERAQAKRDKWLQDYHRFHPHPILALEDSAYLRVQAGEMVLKRGNCWLFAKDDDGRRRFEHAVFHEFG